jgi:hypothetical protein
MIQQQGRGCACAGGAGAVWTAVKPPACRAETGHSLGGGGVHAAKAEAAGGVRGQQVDHVEVGQAIGPEVGDVEGQGLRGVGQAEGAIKLQAVRASGGELDLGATCVLVNTRGRQAVRLADGGRW